MVDAVAVFFRALSFIALFQAAGGAVFLVLFGAQLGPARRTIVRRVRLAAGAAVVLVLLQFSLEATRLADDFAGLWDGPLQQLAWQSTLGTALRLRLAGLVLVLAGLALSRGRITSGLLTAAGTALVIAAFATLGHTVDHPRRALLAALLSAHLLSISFWFGGLWPLRQAVTVAESATAAVLLERFSRLAVWIVPGLLLAGAGLVIALVGGLSVFGTTYGQLLLAKLAGFGALLGLAALNKLRLTPALRRKDESAVPRLRRALLIEYLLMAAVLGVTAVMTGLYSPA